MVTTVFSVPFKGCRLDGSFGSSCSISAISLASHRSYVSRRYSSATLDSKIARLQGVRLAVICHTSGSVDKNRLRVCRSSFQELSQSASASSYMTCVTRSYNSKSRSEQPPLFLVPAICLRSLNSCNRGDTAQNYERLMARA